MFNKLIDITVADGPYSQKGMDEREVREGLSRVVRDYGGDSKDEHD